MKAISVHQFGGPEVLKLEEVDIGKPGAGQALVRITNAGVNFVDIYIRRGAFSTPLPYIPGWEGAGVVESVGEGVTSVKPGDRVAYVHTPPASGETTVRSGRFSFLK